MLRELLEEYGLDDAEITRETTFHEDLELESIDLVALSGSLREHYGDRVNFAEFVADLELEEIISLTVGSWSTTSWRRCAPQKRAEPDEDPYRRHHHARAAPLRGQGRQEQGEAPVVVFVHGLLTDSLASYYFTLGPSFAAAGIDVIMYDLRGHGRSERPETGYQIEYFVDDLVALLDALGERRRVHVVGNSFGGTVAAGVAAWYRTG